jgi:hypothetical protein
MLIARIAPINAAVFNGTTRIDGIAESEYESLSLKVQKSSRIGGGWRASSYYRSATPN